jgi:CRP-like cAMP-binding protein
MQGTPGPPTTNQLLKALPAKARQRLLRRCRPYRLKFADVLCEPGARMRHVYFPNRGLISLLTPVEGRANVEVGMVGREGIAGIPLFLGITTSPVQWLVQGAGDAWRIPAAAFKKETAGSPALQQTLNRYLHTFIVQVAQTAACNSSHELSPRLARWLLMTHDRMQSDTFVLTQEFLAKMLSVQRAGVTNAASTLQKRKLIRYRRGNITILDRRGLERAACSCYRTVNEIVQRAWE